MENRRMARSQNVDDRVEEEEAQQQMQQMQQTQQRARQQEELFRHTHDVIAARMRVAGGPAESADAHFVRPRSRGLQIHRQIAGF